MIRITLCLLLCGSLAWADAKDGRLDVYWVDVEGGAATLIVTPAGQTVLIDSGNPGRRDPDRIAQAITKVAQLRQVDFLITTHYHRDHYGGAATLATMLPIKTVYDNGKSENTADYPGDAYFEFPAEKRVVIHPGDTLPLKQSEKGPELKLTCLATRKLFMKPPANAEENASLCAEHKPKKRDGSDNANSVAVVVELGPFRFFDGGDLTWNQEVKLICPKNLVGEVDVYQVTHHGLDSSNNPVVVKALKPTVAVMNNGVTKGCKPEVFETLTSAKSIQSLYQVHKNRRPDGKINNTKDEYIANHPKDCQGNYIKMSVAPTGDSYELSIPAHGHRQTYKTKKK